MLSPNALIKMFGRSPIRPLQEHMGKVVSCALQLVPFIKAVTNKEWEEAAEIQNQIIALEHEADELKCDLRLHMPQSLFLPLPRTDLLVMVTLQDRIANKARDIAGLMLGRKMCLPEKISEPYLTFLHRCLETAEQANEAIGELDKLLEAGFRGSEVKVMEDMINELARIEHETDEMQVGLRQHLFDIEPELPPVDVMFLYQVINWTGDLADLAEDVGNQLHLLLAR